MFFSRRADVIESDKGFFVQILGRTGIKYCEGEHVLFVDSEVLAHGYGIAIFSKSINVWQAPHSEEVITAGKKKEIIENIRQAIAFQNQPVEVL